MDICFQFAILRFLQPHLRTISHLDLSEGPKSVRKLRQFSESPVGSFGLAFKGRISFLAYACLPPLMRRLFPSRPGIYTDGQPIRSPLRINKTRPNIILTDQNSCIGRWPVVVALPTFATVNKNFKRLQIWQTTIRSLVFIGHSIPL